tara:strand:- start:399 stop:713 length:315 start_codon:yes stop_codon:yes gene_type:complete
MNAMKEALQALDTARRQRDEVWDRAWEDARLFYADGLAEAERKLQKESNNSSALKEMMRNIEIDRDEARRIIRNAYSALALNQGNPQHNRVEAMRILEAGLEDE